VGDIHQPLHVGAVYLDAHGARVDPDAGRSDAAADTAGGNAIVTMLAATNQRGANLHSTWDAIPLAWRAGHVGPAWIAQARKVPRTHGSPPAWPAAWATETLARAREAYSGLAFGEEHGGEWAVSLSCGYYDRMTLAKKRQLTLAGARLAQLLQALWP